MIAVPMIREIRRRSLLVTPSRFVTSIRSCFSQSCLFSTISLWNTSWTCAYSFAEISRKILSVLGIRLSCRSCPLSIQITAWLAPIFWMSNVCRLHQLATPASSSCFVCSRGSYGTFPVDVSMTNVRCERMYDLFHTSDFRFITTKTFHLPNVFLKKRCIFVMFNVNISNTRQFHQFRNGVYPDLTEFVRI